MNYFVTGSHGFIGKHIVERLKKDGHVITRYNRSRPIIIPPDTEAIIHSAAEIYNEGIMVDVNVMLTCELLEAAKTAKLKSFIYIGSSSEYGKKDHPMQEDEKINPRTIYEATKASGTFLTQAFAETFKLPTAIVRPFSIYGPGEPAHRFIPTLLRAVKTGEEIVVSEGTHDFTYITDFVEGLFAVEKAIQKGHALFGDIVNIGSGVETSNLELVKLVEKITKKKLNYKTTTHKLRSFDTDHWCANITRLKHLYQYEPSVDLKTGLKKTYEYNL